jgi:hypothetical protein
MKNAPSAGRHMKNAPFPGRLRGSAWAPKIT